jgi:hypothetical protein
MVGQWRGPRSVPCWRGCSSPPVSAAGSAYCAKPCWGRNGPVRRRRPLLHLIPSLSCRPTAAVRQRSWPGVGFTRTPGRVGLWSEWTRDQCVGTSWRSRFQRSSGSADSTAFSTSSGSSLKKSSKVTLVHPRQMMFTGTSTGHNVCDTSCSGASRLTGGKEIGDPLAGLLTEPR